MVIYGGVNIKEQKEALKAKPPHIVVGTPGRIKQARAAKPRGARVEPDNAAGGACTCVLGRQPGQCQR
jgi:hypothetical protein